MLFFIIAISKNMTRKRKAYKRLPIKDLRYKPFINLLGDARESLARLDELVKNLPSEALLAPLYQEEVLHSLRPQKRPGNASSLIQALKQAAKTRNLLTIKCLCKTHSIIKQEGPNQKDIGHIRTRQNWIGTEGCLKEEAYFYPPKPQLVRPLLQNLFSFLSKTEEPLLQAAIGFAQLLIIHPFIDGNGRLARIYIPAYLVKRKIISKPVLFLSGYFEKDRLKYFRFLFKITTENAWENWIIYFLKGVIQQTKTTRSKLLKIKYKR